MLYKRFLHNLPMGQISYVVFRIPERPVQHSMLGDKAKRPLRKQLSLEKLAGDKYSSLLGPLISPKEKRFYDNCLVNGS